MNKRPVDQKVINDLEDEDLKLFNSTKKIPNSAVPSNPVIQQQPAAAVLVTQPAAKKPKVGKAAKPKLPFVLIKVCHWGNNGSGRNSWTKKNLSVLGVYDTEDEAKTVKAQIMSRFDQTHADILIGGNEDDEYDLVIRTIGDKLINNKP